MARLKEKFPQISADFWPTGRRRLGADWYSPRRGGDLEKGGGRPGWRIGAGGSRDGRHGREQRERSAEPFRDSDTGNRQEFVRQFAPS